MCLDNFRFIDILISLHIDSQKNMSGQELSALSEQILFSPCGIFIRYINRAAKIYPFHFTATKEVSTDKEFCLGNSVLYPGLEGEFQRSEPYLFAVFRFFTKDDVLSSPCRGELPVSCLLCKQSGGKNKYCGPSWGPGDCVLAASF